MNVLAITSLYPSPFRRNAGLFNALQLRNLPPSIHCEVIAPVPWTSRFRTESGPPADVPAGTVAPACAPLFIYPPGFLRSAHGHCFFRAILAPAEKLRERTRFDVVYGMFAYPDGWGAAALARKWAFLSS